MARYEFECTDCGARREVEYSMMASIPIQLCQVCNAPMRKLFAAPGIVFKGGGWACKTITRRNGSPASAEAKPVPADTKTGQKESKK